MSTENAQSLPGLGQALETNFIIEKFNGLPWYFQRLIYEGLHADSIVCAAAGLVLLHLAVDAADGELTAYINSRLDAPFDDWIIMPGDLAAKAALLAGYFRAHLKFEDGKFLIEPMAFMLGS